MHVAARKPLATCVALVGASAIALTPVTVTPALHTVTPPAIAAVTTPVNLTSATNPFVALGDLISGTGASVNATADKFWSDPFPLLRKIIENQFANGDFMITQIGTVLKQLPSIGEQLGVIAETFIEDIRTGNFVDAGSQITAAITTAFLPIYVPIYGVFEIMNNTAKNIAAAAQTFASGITLTILSLMGPLNAYLAAGADVAQTVFDAFEEGDAGAAIGALLSAPIVQLDAVLNGFRKDEFSFLPGIFTVGTNPFENGPISAFLSLAKVLADSLTPIPNPEAASATLAKSADVSDPGAVPELTSLATISVSVEDSSAETTEEAAAEAPAEPVETSPAEPADETLAAEEIAVEDVESESETPPVEDEEPGPVDDDVEPTDVEESDAGDADETENADDAEDADDEAGDSADGESGSDTNDGGEA